MHLSQQLDEQSGIALRRREMLSPYHAVELYQDDTMWIIDGEDPPREIKLEPQAVQRLRDFLMKPDDQHYTAPYPYQQHMTTAHVQPAKRPTKRDNDDAIFWLLIFTPVGLYMMWTYATWPDVVKGIITLALVAVALVFLLHGLA